jgi:translin
MAIMSSTLHDHLEVVRAELTAKNASREKAVNLSRELIRHCSEGVRAIHRREWDNAQNKLNLIGSIADDMRALTLPFPELYHTGYTMDALKEVVEANLTYAIIRNLPLPSAQDLKVEGATYLNGMCEAATELRRFILDMMRREDNHNAEVERLLEWMDTIYDEMVTFDFPDALTGGLRRQTDVLRGVLERTRGDVTSSLRQQLLQDAIQQLEQKLKPS